MLLLVLILVVIAFGLLVVALLTGSVLWAWVSVGVSVVAAVVLLIDWLQRRSAVKAGAVAPVSAPPARPTPVVDLDPATEILPVVPASERRGSEPDGPPADRTERVSDAQQTVAMPVVQPSGSSARPPGAEVTVTSSGGVSSPSVTKAGSGSSASTAPGEADDEVTSTTFRAPAAASGDTVSVPGESASAASETQSSDAVEPASGAEEQAPAKPSLSKGDGSEPEGAAEPSSTAERTEVVRQAATPEPDDTGSDAATTVVRGPAPAEESTTVVRGAAPAEAAPSRSAPFQSAPSGSEQTVVTSLAAVTGSRPDPASDAPKPPAAETPGSASSAAADQDSTSDVEKTVKVEARPPKNPSSTGGSTAASTPPPIRASDEPGPDAGGPEPEATAVVSPPERAPVDEVPAAEPTVVVDQSPPAEQTEDRPPARKDVDLFAPAGESVTSGAGAPASEPPPGPPGEAPEEQSDPIAAEIVSGLDDEVVVVDEQPRYHVATCRSLVSIALIPLPVREAVELGFTPCGWCSPERTLAGRHRTAAR